ncbi:MAG TPA: hypothetical protein VGQ57_14390, partial [Polyangiaceae bacterium]|nr:hypothetical protein [Polyangiaceae bacterium]
SFLMGLALIAEWHSFRRTARLACFGLALLLTYSGTGLLVLFIAMLFPLGRGTLVRLAVLGAAGAIVLFLLGDALNLWFTLGRLDEFGAERSSAYIRYIAPFRLIADTLGSTGWSAWLGHGPGAIARETAAYEFHDPTWAKLLFEYGIFGAFACVGLFVVALRTPVVPERLRAVLFCSWLVMGGHLLTPEQNFLTLALVGLLGPARPLEPLATSEFHHEPAYS